MGLEQEQICHQFRMVCVFDPTRCVCVWACLCGSSPKGPAAPAHGAGPGPGPAHEGINFYAAQEGINSKGSIIDI